MPQVGPETSQPESHTRVRMESNKEGGLSWSMYCPPQYHEGGEGGTKSGGVTGHEGSKERTRAFSQTAEEDHPGVHLG